MPIKRVSKATRIKLEKIAKSEFFNQLPRRKQRGMYKISLSSAQFDSVGA